MFDEKTEDSLRALAKNRDFQQVVAAMLKQVGAFDVVFNGNSRDAYHLGRRSVMIELLNEIKEADEEVAARILTMGVIDDERS